MRTSEKIDSKAARRMGATGLKTALTILTKWGCTPSQQQAILDLPKATFYKYQGDPDSANLSRDQLERISYLLNIHAHLRVIFENPDNVYGFMAMNNNNPYFNGKSPLEIIGTGNFGALYETAKRIDALRSGQW